MTAHDSPPGASRRLRAAAFEPRDSSRGLQPARFEPRDSSRGLQPARIPQCPNSHRLPAGWRLFAHGRIVHSSRHRRSPWSEGTAPSHCNRRSGTAGVCRKTHFAALGAAARRQDPTKPGNHGGASLSSETAPSRSLPTSTVPLPLIPACAILSEAAIEILFDLYNRFSTRRAR